MNSFARAFHSTDGPEDCIDRRGFGAAVGKAAPQQAPEIGGGRGGGRGYSFYRWVNPETCCIEPSRRTASPEKSVPAAQSQNFGDRPYIGFNVP
jgi:hypothetical protein